MKTFKQIYKLCEDVIGIEGASQRPYGSLAAKKIKYVATAPTDKNPKTPTGMTFLQWAKQMPDTHNQPGARPLEGYEAYGRWWFDGQQIRVNGGPMGSSTGHPGNAEIAGYWGVKSFNEKGRPTGAVLLRGRMLSDEEGDFIEEENYKEDILEAISKLIPRIT